MNCKSVIKKMLCRICSMQPFKYIIKWKMKIPQKHERSLSLIGKGTSIKSAFWVVSLQIQKHNKLKKNICISSYCQILICKCNLWRNRWKEYLYYSKIIYNFQSVVDVLYQIWILELFRQCGIFVLFFILFLWLKTEERKTNLFK
jgi:hypothetical protein